MPVSREDFEFLAAIRHRDYQVIGKRLRHAKKFPKGTLSEAVGTGDVALMDLLLNEGRFTQSEIDSGFFSAINESKSKLAERLLDAGASSRHVGGLLSTPVLVLAIQRGLVKIARCLIERQADPNSHDVPWAGAMLGTPIGRTALMAAAERGYAQIVDLLLKAGANPWIEGQENKTAYDLVAKRRGRETVATILAEWMNKHPQTSASPPPPLELKLSAPFTSWDDAVRQLEKATSGKGSPHPQAKSVIRFPLSLEVATVLAGKAAGGKPVDNYRNALATVQNLSVNLGASWFLQFEPGQGAFLCGLAKGDKWKVLGAFKTACANFGVTHASLLKFLKSLDAEQPFDLTECDFNSVGGRFRGTMLHPEATAQRLFEFCPFVAEDDAGSVKRLAKQVAKTGDFKIWWD